MLQDYLAAIGLRGFDDFIETTQLNHFVEHAFAIKREFFSELEVQSFYECMVGVAEERKDGTVVIREIDETPFHLADTYGIPKEYEDLRSHESTLRLWRLNHVFRNLLDYCETNLLGIYRFIPTPQPRMVREAYNGNLSRPEFPLNEEFINRSNISQVGHTGKAILIQNLETHAGPYYQCNTDNVLSEFCCPILNEAGETVGLIDAESEQVDFFTPDRVLQIVKDCMDLGRMDPVFARAKEEAMAEKK